MRKRCYYKMMAMTLTAALLGMAACGGATAGAPQVTEAPDGQAETENLENKEPQKDSENGSEGKTDMPGALEQQPEESGKNTAGESDKDSVGENSTAAEGTKLSDELSEQIRLVKEAEPETTQYNAVIRLSENSIDIEGNGCKTEEGVLKIKEAGTYCISGSLSSGMIYVNTDDESEVVLVLDGVSVHNETGAALYCKKAKKVTVVLKEGTVNSFSDGTGYVFEEGEDEPDATVFAKHDLVITGTGTLVIHSAYKDALKGKDSLFLLGGKLEITSAEDGIVGRDLLYVSDGTITVDAAADALKSTNDQDVTLGMIVIDGGRFSLKAAEDAIQAENMLLIQDGTFEITTGKGADGAERKTGMEPFGGGGFGGFDKFGDFGGRRAPGDNEATGQTPASQPAAEETASVKGLKAVNGITVYGGSFSLDTEDDALHSNNLIEVMGGSFTIKAGDDGMHADEALIVAGSPDIAISKSYEGLEAKTITVAGGTLDIVSEDDGINVTEGTGQTGFGGMGMFSAGKAQLNINGGILTINANGDGLDANGSITMNGGTVVVYGPTNEGNGTLDYDGSFTVNGGSILCIGSSGMAQAPSGASGQYSLSAFLTEKAEAGSTVEIQIDGKTVLEATAQKQFSNIVASSAEFSKESNARVLVNGTEVFSGTLTNVVTNFGNATGGFGGMGGGKGRPGRPEDDGNPWGNRGDMENGVPPMGDGWQPKNPRDGQTEEKSGEPVV